MIQITKHREVKTYTHQGVAVCVEINYDKGTISVLDQNGNTKSWVFAKREIEYMAGWQNILDAMKLAIEEATKDLHKHQEAKKKVLNKKRSDLMEAIEEHKPHLDAVPPRRR